MENGLFAAPTRDILIWLAVTLALGAPGAAAAGRALARGWRSFAVGIVYAAMLAAGADFLCYALFRVSALPIFRVAERVADGEAARAAPLLAAYVATFVILVAFAYSGWRMARARQMRAQYPFLAEP